MRRLTPMILLASVLLVPGSATAGGGGQGPADCDAYSEGQQVSMRDTCFSGTAQFAAPGPVTATNDGLAPHTYTEVNGAFDTGVVGPGSSADIDVEEGVYQVYCTLHSPGDGSGMAGVLIVGAPFELAAVPVGGGIGPGLGLGFALAALAAVLVGVLGVSSKRRRARPPDAG